MDCFYLHGLTETDLLLYFKEIRPVGCHPWYARCTVIVLYFSVESALLSFKMNSILSSEEGKEWNCEKFPKVNFEYRIAANFIEIGRDRIFNIFVGYTADLWIGNAFFGGREE